MNKVRFIARLDIKGANLIKGINLEGLKIIGKPKIFSEKYYNNGADELLLIDSVASLYNRDNLINILKETTENIFIPVTAGGGVRNVSDARQLLFSGADKVAINSAAIRNPEIISSIAEEFGSQCVVLSIEAKKKGDSWEAFIENGREPTGLNVIDWVIKSQKLGVGEILLTSIDQEGTEKGFDEDLAIQVSKVSNVPIIVSGGMGKLSDLNFLDKKVQIDGIAIASVLHFNRFSISEIKDYANNINIQIRN
tara:strand:+ start:2602 stop:3357 length:756 start_codon:yes stop_codon:yes gene_type:complete